ncbi:DUF5009 domain-containing protein [Spirosoma sp.]|uniref:acyltransferase family protein n=1 Tax=Spirosoma sp. TaxID=1899569 RepID=UPI002618B408|nr:DUF5009 domain-containing protein [Spirosoma sp.]MCX6213005.1 DUF5009 domain-containing protein [Spirosoma sp.]
MQTQIRQEKGSTNAQNIERNSQSTTLAPTSRLQSLDTLRGFDMFWISGGDKFIHVLADVTGWGWSLILAEQFTHVYWNGFHAYDLIFPLFLFLAGVSTPFSLGSRLQKGVSPNQLIRKVVQRGIILVLLGILYNNGLFKTEWATMRYPSVLGRIGLAGMFAQIIYLYSSRRTQYIWFGSLLIGYWLIIQFVPVPGCGAGLITPECNPATYLDKTLLPGRMYNSTYDPVGILSTLPAISTGLLGIFAGNLLLTNEQTMPKSRKALWLALSGIICLGTALLWNTVFPINKILWSSPFVLLTGGFSLLLLALFYTIIDVLNWRRLTSFFIVIGMNSIVIYMIGKFIDFRYTSNALFGGFLSFFSEPVQALGSVVATIAVLWGFMYFLYRQKLFLKL